MPEMPEVRTVSKYVNKDVQGKTILDTKFLIKKMVRGTTPSHLSNVLKGKKINNVSNIGKHIIFDLSENIILISHLRMEGKYRFEKDLDLNKHDHAWFRFSNGYLIFSDTRKFGTFDLRDKKTFTKVPPISQLGFLAEDIDINYFYNKLQRKSIAIKSTLLDQSLIIGLGNIYVDEVLWDIKLNPKTASKDVKLSKAKEILKATQRILDKATKHNGSTIKTYKAYNKMEGSFQNFLKVHTKVGKPCPRCNNIIKKTKVNGRGTYYCSKCQKNN